MTDVIRYGEGMERAIEVRKVVGAGGRVRTVAICEIGHWHGNYNQAMRCKNAIAMLKAR